MREESPTRPKDLAAVDACDRDRFAEPIFRFEPHTARNGASHDLPEMQITLLGQTAQGEKVA